MADPVIPWRAFEDEVFAYVDRWLKGRRFFVCPDHSKVYRKRSYYSEPRKASIEFEVAIESFDKGATKPSLVWVWECKDHIQNGRSVEVKDVEVLLSKIDQLGRSKFRGSIVTTHGFQSGALELAKSAGISLDTLRKTLRRITCFSQDTDGYDEEVFVVESGVTAGGKDTGNGQWLEIVLSQWYRAVQPDAFDSPTILEPTPLPSDK